MKNKTMLTPQEIESQKAEVIEFEDKNSKENFEKKTTLFYSLKTGEIKITCGGIQDMDFFGADKYDYNYGFIVIENDAFVLDNLKNFMVVDGVLKMKYNPLEKYQLA